ncbi:DUF4286 family protein (plasmid) [Pedobacter sp. BS3]|uniref:DUF4286 family protein n=1 Tax=Pedobacter sp. BS3 TaxID=2567937 RepID=UPI0011F07613|nr:DUF4286 family protein [Pedobacter sp. BS3]TZF85517.1 DUF4286 family protein [Pedobacter sp. BS3]
MLLYNVTVIVNEAIEDAWLAWIKNEHIPEVMSAGAFVSQRLLKVLNSPNEGVTYCLQYIADSQNAINHYSLTFEQEHLAQHYQNFGQGVALFNTLMEFIDHQ